MTWLSTQADSPTAKIKTATSTTRSKVESLALCQVDISYGSQTLLSHVNFIFQPGKAICIQGKMGSGKSAFLKVLAGLLPPTQGQFLFNGHSVYDLSFEEFLPLRLNIGYGFDLGGLLNNRTLRENLELQLRYHHLFPSEEISDRVERILKIFHLNSVAHCRPSSVSGSQRKATCLARALVSEPQVILLDDPTTGLNEILRQALMDHLLEHMNRYPNTYLILTSEDSIFADKLGAKKITLPSGE